MIWVYNLYRLAMTGIYINRISLIANGEKLPEGMWKASSIPAVPNLAEPG